MLWFHRTSLMIFTLIRRNVNLILLDNHVHGWENLNFYNHRAHQRIPLSLAKISKWKVIDCSIFTDMIASSLSCCCVLTESERQLRGLARHTRWLCSLSCEKSTIYYIATTADWDKWCAEEESQNDNLSFAHFHRVGPNVVGGGGVKLRVFIQISHFTEEMSGSERFATIVQHSLTLSWLDTPHICLVIDLSLLKS